MEFEKKNNERKRTIKRGEEEKKGKKGRKKY